MRQLEVYVNDVKAGLLTELNPGKGYTFVYTEAYAASDMPPVSLTPKDGQTVVWMCGCWMDVGDGNDGMDVWCGMSSDT